MAKSNSIKSMTVYIPDKEIDALKLRLKLTRWPSPIESSNWADGTDSNYLRSLVDYWADQYNWREREKRINSYNHFVAEVEGTNIHFIHEKGKGENPIPLLLMQGWPSSFIQMLDIIPLLTESRQDGTPSFDVVAASLPGYPFSQIPVKHGMSFFKIAQLMKKLMVEELGYQKFAMRGSDQGALVQQQVALKFPEHVIGIHRTGITPFLNPLSDNLTDAEISYQQKVAAWAKTETAYADIHGLRPETITPALADSPVGLASWIIEKFHRWGDCNRDIDSHFGRDKLLDNLSLHWFMGSGAASIRLYHEMSHDPGLTGRINLPTAIIMPLHDGITVPAPKEWTERFYNVQLWTVMERGGHFPEWEIPNETADDIRRFFMTITK
ncbi:MAG: epoxide hydrolase [Ferruginibacter sp.]|nr:epoxide hydrolase [Ferruginibacter sp.]